MKMNQPEPLFNGQHCGNKSECPYLLIPTSNSRMPDRCLKFGVIIDRDDRQRPLRTEACMELDNEQ